MWGKYWIPSLCQWNLNSGSQSLLRFRIPWAVFRIPKPRIPDSTSKIFPESGFHLQKIAGVLNLDSFSWDDMHIVNSYVDPLSTEIEKYHCLCSINCPHAYGVVHNFKSLMFGYLWTIGCGKLYKMIWIYKASFYMTSQRPYWFSKTLKRRPCWCPKPILWE